MKTNTLDFTREVIGGFGSDITIDEIWGDSSETIETSIEDIVTEPEIIEDSIEEVIKEDSLPAVTLDDITYEGESDDVENSEGSFNLLDGVRSALVNKLKRNNIDPESYNLAEMDEESLVDFEEELDMFIINNKYESLKQVNPDLNKVLTFIENGGDPKAITKLFKEQEVISQIDGSTDEGKVKKISSYYKDVLGWEEEKVSKKLDRLKNTNTVEDEYNDIEEEYSKYFDKKQEDILKQQEQESLRLKQIEESRKVSFSQKLDTISLPKNVKDSIFNTAFGKGKIKGTETIVDVIDHKISLMKSDPDSFIELAQFISDPKAYKDYISQNTKNEKVEEGMKRGFSAVTKTRQSEIQSPKTSTKKTSPFKFN